MNKDTLYIKYCELNAEIGTCLYIKKALGEKLKTLRVSQKKLEERLKEAKND